MLLQQHILPLFFTATEVLFSSIIKLDKANNNTYLQIGDAKLDKLNLEFLLTHVFKRGYDW
jgi:hypothetical protein